MTCHRRYMFTAAVEVGHRHVREQLEQACEEYWWYSAPDVRGEGLGILQVEFQVAARDQWWAHKRAMNLMERATWGLDIQVPTPTWENLPPHENRGRYRANR